VGAADRRLLPEGRMTGPMPWVIAIMMLLTVLAAAVGLGLGRTAQALEGGDRITVQILEADPARRESQAQSVLRSLEGSPGVRSAVRVEAEEMRRLLEPWLGQLGPDADIPVPALIDVELAGGAAPQALSRRIQAAAPSARIDDHAASLAPLAKLVDALRLLAVGLVLLMAGATAATVVLASRAALDTHRETIAVLHLMGATDAQLARLFQRRIALDALFGGVLGFAAALLVLWLVGERVSALGSELAGSAGLAPGSWALLASLPLAGVLLAMAVARWSVMRALRRLP
jgi:cell division transport system permease protein